MFVRSATPGYAGVDVECSVHVELEEGVQRSTCETVLGFFFGGVLGFTSLSDCTYCAFMVS